MMPLVEQIPKGRELAPMEVLALTDTTKLLFNVVHLGHNRFEGKMFRKAAPNLLRILTLIPLPEWPMVEPITVLINAAMDCDMSEAFPEETGMASIKRLIEILDFCVSDKFIEGEIPKFDDNAAPIVILLRNIAAKGPKHIRDYMKEKLLPNER